MTKGPLIQLGTGEGGSGVGTIVDNTGGRVGEGVAEEAPGVGGGEDVEKRGNDDVVAQQQPQRRAKVTTMYIRRGMSEGKSFYSDPSPFFLSPFFFFLSFLHL